MKRTRILFLAILTLLVLAACSDNKAGEAINLPVETQPAGAVQPGEAQQPSSDQQPGPGQSGNVQTAEPSEREVLFRDDFSDPSSGWDRISVTDGVTDYAEGAYRIFVNTADTDVWANPNLLFEDARVEVIATKAGGSDNNDYGVICRYIDGDNFYFFVISSDGFYGIGKVKDGLQTLIEEESMPSTDKVLQGNAANHIVGECSGSTLRMYVNGTLLAEYQDSDFTFGDVGLMAGSFDDTGTDIYFDDFVVYAP